MAASAELSGRTARHPNSNFMAWAAGDAAVSDEGKIVHRDTIACLKASSENTNTYRTRADIGATAG
jgi:hypothetical protein